MSGARHWVKSHVSPGWLVRLRCLTRGYPLPRWGNLRRTTPISQHYGFERGTPIDRYYLEQFFTRERAAITGRVLEIQSPGYTQRFGEGVSVADSLDIVGDHAPTYVCDLSRSDGIVPSDAYDCFLLPNTLHHLRDLESALRHALRVVKPGGTVLASATGFVPLTPDAEDYWHLSAAGWREVTSRAFGGREVTVESYGNALAASAAMMGVAAEELSPGELEVRDLRYPVLVTIRCRK